MAHRELLGEPVETIHYITAESLAEALAEAAVVIAKSESNSSHFRLVQQWNEEEGYELIIYTHNA